MNHRNFFFFSFEDALMTTLDLIERKVIAHSPSDYETTIATHTIIQTAQIAENTKKITLILDLDETLVHSRFHKPDWYDYEMAVQYNGESYTIYVQKRPGFDEFFKTIENLYDIYIFTASIAEYAVPVVKTVLPDFPTNKILTRYHCQLIDGTLVKDLNIFDKDLSSVIIVDNSPACYKLQPENGIEVSSWLGDATDNELITYLLPILQAGANVDDVRKFISSILNMS